MNAIVTIKLPANPKHDPKNKIAGSCPLNNGNQCSDVTGEHHSFLIMDYQDGFNAVWILEAEMTKKYGHVTRIEILNPLILTFGSRVDMTERT